MGSHDDPKPLVPVNGTSILARAVRNLVSVGVREIVLVVGYRADEIIAAMDGTLQDVEFTHVVSDQYRTTNNAYSLWLAREYLDEDLYLVEADVVFDAELLTRLADSDAPAVSAVSPWRPGMHGTVAELGERSWVRRFLLAAHQDPGQGLDGMAKTVNIHLLRRSYLRREFVPRLDELIAGGGHGEYYEQVLAGSVDRGVTVLGRDCGDLRWCEIDDGSDLVAAEYLFGTVDERLGILDRLRGGYWRHDVVDHCLLYNAYFPGPDLHRELARVCGDALVHYPVGHSALQDLLAALIDQPPERLVLANGASELIKVLGRVVDSAAVVVPGFNEYEQVFPTTHRVELTGPAFALDPDLVCRSAVESGARAVVVTSPNNPTSIAVPREDLLRLAKLLAGTGTVLVVDESFIDFSQGQDTLEPHLADHANVVVVKSMSKVYGVCGLRLGYLATADLDLVARVRRELPIWNVNGLAEAFLRLLPRFEEQFRRSVEQVRADSAQLYAGLASLEGVHVWRPDANFVLVRLPEPWTGPRVRRALFAGAGILVKDCAGKSMRHGERYLRISSRTGPENARLVTALADVLAR